MLPRCGSISAAQRHGGRPPQLVAGQPVECGGEGRDIARVEDHSLDYVADEVGQVAGPPPDDRQAGGQGLAVDGAVRFPPAGQHEDVGAGVEAGDAVPVEYAVVHDPVAEDGEAAPDPLGVGRLDVVPAGEVERDPVVGEAAQCVEQLQHPLRVIQLPTLTAAARRPWRRSGTGPVGMAATSLPGAMTRMQSAASR